MLFELEEGEIPSYSELAHSLEQALGHIQQLSRKTNKLSSTISVKILFINYWKGDSAFVKPGGRTNHS